MPKLPDYTALGAPVQPNPSGATPSYSAAGHVYTGTQGGEYLGKALQKIGGDLTDYASDQKKKSDLLQEAQAEASFQTASLRKVSELSQDADYETAPERYKESAGAALEESAKSIADPTKRELFKLKQSVNIERGNLHFEQQRFEGRKVATIAETDAQLDELRGTALTAADEPTRQQIIQTGGKLILGLREAGYLTPAEAVKRQKDWTEKYAVASLDAMPPDKAVELLRQAVPGKSGASTPNGQAITDTAGRLGIAPRDLAAAISYETGGSFNPSMWGGKGNNYLGLIQFGPEERKKYGVKPGMDFDEQMGAVESFLKDRGLKPGMGISEIYSIINAGSLDKNGQPRLNASDGNGTVGTHIEKIKSQHYASADKVLGGATLAPKTGTVVDFIDPGKLPQMLNVAESRYLTEQNRKNSEAAAENFRFKATLGDDIAKITATGKADDSLDPSVVASKLGPKEAVEWQAKRQDAYTVWGASHDFATLPEHEISLRLQALTPKPDQPDFVRQQAVHKSVSDYASTILKKRSEDPAGSVDGDPQVQAAYGAVQAGPQDAGAQKALFDARLAAQQRANVVNPSPITKSEALDLTAPLEGILPGQERAALNEVAKKAQEKYGDYADEALGYAFRARKMSNDTATIAARVLKNLNAGTAPQRADLRSLDQQTELDAANRVLPQARETFDYKPDYSPPPVKTEGANIPAKAISDLRADPRLAVQFEAKYGKDSAKKILTSYPVR